MAEESGSMNLGRAVCLFKECGLPSRRFGLCDGHSQQHKKAGRPDGFAHLQPLLTRAKRGTYTQCTVENCNRKPAGRGFCLMHLNRVWKRGYAGQAEPLRVASRGCAVSGCGEPHDSLGYCLNHSGRFRRHGSPLAGRQTKNGEPLQWLKDHCEDEDVGECLIWRFAKMPNGYGSVVVDGQRRVASRVMCELAHGAPRLPAAEAAHSCGRGHLGCVHPKHLRWATPKQNAHDKLAHGTVVKGERHGNAKLTAADVRAIRSDRRKWTDVAKDFPDISPTTIYAVVQRRSWKHID